jgi:hypothetical protein
MMLPILLALGLIHGSSLAPHAETDSPTRTALRFQVTLSPNVTPDSANGRLLVVLSRGRGPEPRFAIGNTGVNAAPVLACDVNGFAPGVTAVLDETSDLYPIRHLRELPAGEYSAQAVFDTNLDLRLPNAPGNCYSRAQRVVLDPAHPGIVKLELTEKIPAEQLPPQTDNVKYVKLQSRLLSDFFGRTMYLRAGIILPQGYQQEPNRRYPLRVHIGGYGTRFTQVQGMMSGGEFRQTWLAGDTPRMIFLLLDGAGPFGDPYQVNSANNGPYGDAVTRELIPYVEQNFRAIGRPEARFTDGSSTGGWVSLALQIFYPDFFNGCWSQCPDPVDFRAYELINIYQDENAYVNAFGFERPAMRLVNGDVQYSVRHECQVENVLGRGGRWVLSGKDWCAWNATFGPRGPDGLPRPLWDGRTGVIDRSVVEHWKQYDLRLVLEKNWPALAPRLRGKIHIWVGDADNYFLNNAVHLLDDSLKRADPPFEGKIVFAPGMGHTSGWSQRQVMREMDAAFENGRK